jgi:type VI secretion system protein ImpJ
MKWFARVVWSEGMHLSQHHFQAQSAYFEDVMGATLSGLFHAPWGLLDLQLDDAALLNSTAAVSAARGIMPDGTPFAFPDDAAPEPLRVGDLFSPMQASHLLLLAIPAQAPGRANCSMDGKNGSDLRFSVAHQNSRDETTGMDERPLLIARKNFRLVLDNADLTGLVSMPVARIQRDGAGHFVFDYGFIGPCLRLSANRGLREMAARIIEMLDSRANTVRAERAVAGGSMAEYAPREIAGFWFLHALNSSLPQLQHALRSGSTHPEQFFLQLSRLAGALCTFSLHSHPRELPPYDHSAPEESFRSLEKHIRRHLDVIMPASAVSLPVRETEVGFYAAAVEDPRCFEPAALWFLGVRSSAGAGDVISRAPRLIKVCSAKIISWLAQKAHAGLGLEHVPVPPPELSPRIGTHYFAIRRTDPCWKSVVETSEIGLYAPAALPDLELEIKVVPPQRD